MACQIKRCIALIGFICLLHCTCYGAEANSGVTKGETIGAVYLEVLGRSFFFGSVHLEVNFVDWLAMESGLAMAPVFGSLWLFLDGGLSVRVWSSGRSAVVVGVSLCYMGADNPGENSAGVWVDAVSIAFGAFYEFRDGVLLRLGLMPQVFLREPELKLFPYQGTTPEWYDYYQFAALQVGWVF